MTIISGQKNPRMHREILAIRGHRNNLENNMGTLGREKTCPPLEPYARLFYTEQKSRNLQTKKVHYPWTRIQRRPHEPYRRNRDKRQNRVVASREEKKSPPSFRNLPGETATRFARSAKGTPTRPRGNQNAGPLNPPYRNPRIEAVE